MPQIEPKILKGFRDFLPERQIARERMIEAIKSSYRTFGFEPLETPALEYAEVLTGKYGDEGDKLMYRFRDNGDRDVALRYDLTIPLARVVAMNGDLKKPFKRYQVSPVWRAENTQKGRFREFYQCDADIVGSTSPLADAEILALAAGTLQKLGVKASDFVVRVNSREIISAFYDSLGLSAEEKVAAIRAVDKIDKIGKEGVAEELAKAGIKPALVEQVAAFAETSIDGIENVAELEEVAQAFPSVRVPLKRLVAIVEMAYELAEARFVIDFSIARGLDYYTGLIFETNLTALPAFGSVLSGGRYDGLVGMFSGRQVPAVGASIGLDRLYAALEELGLIAPARSTARALIVNLDESLTDDYLELASDLRAAGVNAILYFEPGDMKKQLGYASDKGIPYALIYGPNEAKEGKVVVKDMERGTQETMRLNEITSYIGRNNE
ncbi:MAG TPA: histidine--tRNA ligase [Candidatus Paceibacterota bacterium]|nr:histidine--tRNA ligase [Candidatus Paceibacterota bacterium]